MPFPHRWKWMKLKVHILCNRMHFVFAFISLIDSQSETLLMKQCVPWTRMFIFIRLSITTITKSDHKFILLNNYRTYSAPDSNDNLCFHRTPFILLSFVLQILRTFAFIVIMITFNVRVSEILDSRLTLNWLKANIQNSLLERNIEINFHCNRNHSYSVHSFAVNPCNGCKF